MKSTIREQELDAGEQISAIMAAQRSGESRSAQVGAHARPAPEAVVIGDIGVESRVDEVESGTHPRALPAAVAQGGGVPNLCQAVETMMMPIIASISPGRYSDSRMPPAMPRWAMKSQTCAHDARDPARNKDGGAGRARLDYGRDLIDEARGEARQPSPC